MALLTHLYLVESTSQRKEPLISRWDAAVGFGRTPKSTKLLTEIYGDFADYDIRVWIVEIFEKLVEVNLIYFDKQIFVTEIEMFGF